jgi:hypothetical protein
MKTDSGSSCRELGLPSGRSVVCRSVAESCDEVTIRGPAGEVLLEVALTPAGPVLRFHAAQVQLDCKGSFQVRCESFEVQTAGNIVQQAGGDLIQNAAGDVRVESTEMSFEARRGNVDVRANDDVNLNGERVRLNC